MYQPTLLVSWQTIGGRTFIQNEVSDELMSLDDVSCEIWNMLINERLSTDEIAARLASDYGISMDSALSDTKELLRSLVDMGVLEDVTR